MRRTLTHHEAKTSERQPLGSKTYLGLVIASHLMPIPMIPPTVTNNPPILCVVKPLSISPSAKSETPNIAVYLAPRSRIILALTIAKNAIHEHVKDPTKERVDGEARRCLMRAA